MNHVFALLLLCCSYATASHFTADNDCKGPGYKCSSDCKTLQLCVASLSPGRRYDMINVTDCKAPLYCDADTHSCSLDSSCAVSRFHCRDNGSYPDPTDCTRHHTCIIMDGVTHIHSQTCGHGYAYDPLSGSCLYGLMDDVCTQGPIPSCDISKIGVVKLNPSIWYLCQLDHKTGQYYPEFSRCTHGVFDVNGFGCVDVETTTQPPSSSEEPTTSDGPTTKNSAATTDTTPKESSTISTNTNQDTSTREYSISTTDTTPKESSTISTNTQPDDSTTISWILTESTTNTYTSPAHSTIEASSSTESGTPPVDSITTDYSSMETTHPTPSTTDATPPVCPTTEPTHPTPSTTDATIPICTTTDANTPWDYTTRPPNTWGTPPWDYTTRPPNTWGTPPWDYTTRPPYTTDPNTPTICYTSSDGTSTQMSSTT